MKTWNDYSDAVLNEVVDRLLEETIEEESQKEEVDKVVRNQTIRSFAENMGKKAFSTMLSLV